MFGFSPYAAGAFADTGVSDNIVEARAAGSCESTLSVSTRIYRLCSGTSSAASSYALSVERVRENALAISGELSNVISFERVRNKDVQLNGGCTTQVGYARVRWLNSANIASNSTVTAIAGYVKYGSPELVSALSSVSCVAREKWEPRAESVNSWTEIPVASDIWTEMPEASDIWTEIPS